MTKTATEWRKSGDRAKLILAVAAAVAANVAQPPSAVLGDVGGRRGPNFLYVEPLTGSSLSRVEPGSGKLLVLCEKSGTLARVDPESGRIEAEAVIDASPVALAAHPHHRRLYVSCRRGQTVVELDASSLQIQRRFPLRGDPTGVAVSGDGRRLYVGVHWLDQVAVFDLESGAEMKRLAVGKGPVAVRLEPRTGRVYVTNLLSNPVSPDQPCQNEITIIDDHTARVHERIILENANIGRQIAFTSDGSLAIAAISRPKNLIPVVQVARGWVVTNGFAVLWPTGNKPPVQLLVDLPNQAYADPYGVAVTPDNKKCYLTAAGLDMVLAIDLAQVRQVADEARDGSIPSYADHLGLSRRYVTARIPVGRNPQAVVVSTDGRWAFVANRLDDSISVIDTATDKVVRTIVLGQPPQPDRLASGEYFFHNASRTFQGQFSCISCHPDETVDGLQYDLEPDGIGENIVDNRNLRGIAGTAPFKWAGTNPDIPTQCGTQTAKWIVRTGWLASAQVMQLSEYILTLPPAVNPYRAPDGRLTPAQQRGKELFERTVTDTGKPIPQRAQCHFCHAGPNFTNTKQFDVGTRSTTDNRSEFDTAHLVNIFESPPYLHDGRAATLEEIWTKYNLEDRHGISSDWTKQQLNDLVEYLKAIGPTEEAP